MPIAVLAQRGSVDRAMKKSSGPSRKQNRPADHWGRKNPHVSVLGRQWDVGAQPIKKKKIRQLRITTSEGSKQEKELGREGRERSRGAVYYQPRGGGEGLVSGRMLRRGTPIKYRGKSAGIQRGGNGQKRDLWGKKAETRSRLRPLPKKNSRATDLLQLAKKKTTKLGPQGAREKKRTNLAIFFNKKVDSGAGHLRWGPWSCLSQ